MTSQLEPAREAPPLTGHWIPYFVTLAACVTAVLIAMNFILPSTVGTYGFDTADADFWGGRIPITNVDPGGPADAAGIRSGDTLRLDRMAFADRIDFFYATVHVPLQLSYEHGQRIATARAVAAAVPETGYSLFTKIIETFLALLYISLAMLIAWKAERSWTAGLIVVFLVSLALYTELTGVENNVGPKTAFAIDLLALPAQWAAFPIALLFPATFPARRTMVQRWILWAGVPIAIAYFVVALLLTGNVLDLSLGIPKDVLRIVYFSIVIFAVFDSIRSASSAYRAQALAAGTTIVLFALVWLEHSTLELMQIRWNDTYYSDWVDSIAGVGMSYAVLRHRLLDLKLAVSRAVIFSTASLLLVSAFVIAEWALALVVGRTVGSRFGGQTHTMLAALVALCVGLSARGVQDAVAYRLNRVFFARRYGALENLHRFALDIDAATDAGALMGLTHSVLERDLDADYVAIYTGHPDSGYVALHKTAAGPARFEPNDEVVLRLRRWGEAFVHNMPPHIFNRAFICPMTLRGTLFGFAVCGPKRDRTSYLPDERETIVSLVHRLGIAYEWLTRQLAAPTTVPLRSVADDSFS